MTKWLGYIEKYNGPIWNVCTDLLCLVESHEGWEDVGVGCADVVCADVVCADEVYVTSSVSFI